MPGHWGEPTQGYAGKDVGVRSRWPLRFSYGEAISYALARAKRCRVDAQVRRDGCTAQNPPEPAQGSLTRRVTAYSGCSAGHPVVWAAFDEGPIAAPQDGVAGDSGTRTWVPQEVWNFFTQFQTSNPPPGTATCRVTNTVSAWNTGLTSNITITNTGTTAIDGWSLVFTLPDDQTITSGWNADYSPASGQVTARNVAHNAAITPDASVDIGFQATHTGNCRPWLQAVGETF